MSITVEEVKKLAKLARIALTPEEEQRHAETISAVLDYMDVLNEVDTENVELTSQVTGLKNIVRLDEIRGKDSQKELIEQMPLVKDGKLAVPAVFEEN
ncbi:MAG: Asp-tRNA(Asn)/Glu-tRNA(Gln) amidotransferase subunit GatC [Patescibacteria group bacterium]